MKNTSIYWNLVDSSQVSEGLEWLSEDEYQQFQGFRFEKRQKDWLLGRWTAKRLIQSIYSDEKDLISTQISIKNETSGAPFALMNGQRMNTSLSISHRGNLAVAALGFNPAYSIGIDLEEIESKSKGFVEDYFTSQEAETILALPSEHQSLIASLFWSGREAILKALRTGLRIDTREIAFQCPSLSTNDDWQPLEIIIAPVSLDSIQLFWRKLDKYLVTLAVISPIENLHVSSDDFIQN